MKFAQVADRAIDELGVKIVILGDAQEKDIAEVIIAAMKNKPVSLAGKTTLGELAAVMKNLDLLVTNDGGLLHMAVALGIKTVSVFGPVTNRFMALIRQTQGTSSSKMISPAGLVTANSECLYAPAPKSVPQRNLRRGSV